MGTFSLALLTLSRVNRILIQVEQVMAANKQISCRSYAASATDDDITQIKLTKWPDGVLHKRINITNVTHY